MSKIEKIYPTGKYRIKKKWYGYTVEAEYLCNEFFEWALPRRGIFYWFKATKKDIKRINKKLK